MTTALTLAPGLRSSSSADSRVMMATTRDGPETSTSTFARRPSTVTSATIPARRLRALRVSPPRSPRSRSTSAAGTTRRLEASRSTVMRPARSHRRSVSRLIPSARAAWAAV